MRVTATSEADAQARDRGLDVYVRAGANGSDQSALMSLALLHLTGRSALAATP